MPKVIRAQEVGPFVVKLKERLPGEDYQTKYAVLTYERDAEGFESIVHLFDCFAYGNDFDYIERKWAHVVETVGYHAEQEVVK